MRVLLIALVFATVSCACPCETPPTRYVVNPASAWGQRLGFNCANTSTSGDVVCWCPCCSDGLLNGLETDVDCGGPCGACLSGNRCISSSDCLPGVPCVGGLCAPPQNAYVIGGGTEGSFAQYYQQTFKLSLASGSLVGTNDVPAIPYQFEGAAIGVLRNKIYVLVSPSTSTSLAWSWDGVATTWTAEGTFANPGMDTRSAAPVVFGSKLYVIGYGNVFSFDGSAVVLETTTPDSTRMGVAVAYNSKIWFAGGWAPSFNGRIPYVLSWDANPLHSWDASHPQLAVPVALPNSDQSVLLNGRWYIFGGESSTTETATIQSWDFNDAGSWVVSPQQLPKGLRNGCAFAYQGRAYLTSMLVMPSPGTTQLTDEIWSWGFTDSDPVVVESLRLPQVQNGASCIAF